MAMCPKCNKEVKYGEPELIINEIYARADVGDVGIDIDMTLKCAECGTELKSINFEDLEGFNFEEIVHKETCPTLLDSTNDKYEEESYHCDWLIEDLQAIETQEEDGMHYGYEVPVILECEHCGAEFTDDSFILKNSASEEDFENLTEE